MKHITEVLPGFKSLKEYAEFMDQLVEKSASGQEIARGMDQHDKSKMQKSDTFVSKKVKKNANGSASETHYSQVDHKLNQLEDAEPEAAEAPQPLEPGMQVNIGRKTINNIAMSPKTVSLDVSGEKDEINLKPHISKEPKTGM